MIEAYFNFVDNFHAQLGVTRFFSFEFLGFMLVAYLIMCFVGPRLMRGKSPFVLHYLSIVHNWILILWSVAMNVGIVVGVARRTMRLGFYRGAFCISDAEPVDLLLTGDIAFWLYNYYISKFYELMDTVLLILKGKRLIFLHVFHHFMMMIGPFLWLYTPWILGGWYCTFVNTIIHTFMYYYYFLTSIGISPSWKSFMTTGQIIQLCSGWVLVSYWLYIAKAENCTRGFYTAIFSHVINTILIAFFVNFYVQQYLRSKKQSRKAKKSE